MLAICLVGETIGCLGPAVASDAVVACFVLRAAPRERVAPPFSSRPRCRGSKVLRFLSSAVMFGPWAACFVSLPVVYEALAVCFEPLTVVHGPLPVLFCRMAGCISVCARPRGAWCAARRTMARARQ